MTLFTASLYLLCLAFLFGSALFVYSRAPQSRLNRYYALLALALLGWVGTLFVFDSLPEGSTLLLVGRANFAAAALVATASCLFVTELAGKRLAVRSQQSIWLETAIVTGISMATPLVDQAETILHGQHVTAYGPLFALYSLHVVAFLASAVIIAFHSVPGASERTRPQLRLVGTGILATALIGVTTNILLPYGLGDFRLINVGPLSTILFLLAMGYAVFAAHLFSFRVIIRAAFVYAGLITLALELYQLAVTFLAHLLPVGDAAERAYAATAIALIVNAFTQQPVRRWLERLIDRSLRPQLNRTRRPHVHQARATVFPKA
ncbi:MAG: histidine kinase N-terminal 7TM domain-containing protein [Janthinobacterium lividum]